PLQIIEEERQRMLLRGEHAQEPPEHRVETSLRVLRRQFGKRGLLADDEFQVRNQAYDELSVQAQRLTNRFAPVSEFDVAFCQERTNQTLKGLRQRGVRNVALVLIELARSKHAARRYQDWLQLVHDGGLADPGVTGH